LIDGLCCVQTKERETAGEGEGDGVLRGDDEELDLLRNKIGERVREARQGKVERIEERRRTGLTVGIGIVRGSLQMCGVTARDFTVLAAARSEKQKGRGRGCLGLFIPTWMR
jgi:hypothetical protein